jgi:TBC1 domain family member 2
MNAHVRSSSFDIAEERNPLSYPSAKKGEGKILRPQYKELLKDPANSLHLIDHPTLAPGSSAKDAEAHNTRISRINKFKRILQASSVSMTEIRSAAWSGVPDEVRAMTWQILLGYLPVNSERRVATLERKRREYLEAVRQSFGAGSTAAKNGTGAGVAGMASNPPVTTGRGRGLDEAIWHQISIDIPRTSPHIPLYSFEATQRSLERLLYVWAIRHPASGYVQGINDLATPFWQVFLGMYITDLNIESGMDPGQLPRPVLDAVEADTYWCLTKLLEGIQDNYIVGQPGIHRQVAALRDLTTRIDAGLAKHFEAESVEYMQFSFRWMNCLLMRELSIRSVIRMWDTYMVGLFMSSLEKIHADND